MSDPVPSRSNHELITYAEDYGSPCRCPACHPRCTGLGQILGHRFRMSTWASDTIQWTTWCTRCGWQADV